MRFWLVRFFSGPVMRTNRGLAVLLLKNPILLEYEKQKQTTARPRLVRMTGPEKNRTNQKRTIYLLKPKITLKSDK